MTSASLVINLDAIRRSQPDPGATPDGRLRFQRRLGGGSDGHIYVAEGQDGHTAAVKVFTDEEARRRLPQLKRVMARLCHPNVVSHYHLHETASHAYLEMELCEEDLLQRIIRTRHSRLPPSLAWSLFVQVLEGLRHCHSLGVYHMDIKPENILLCEEGSMAKLADFGNAVLRCPPSSSPPDLEPEEEEEEEEDEGGEEEEYIGSTSAYVAPELLYRCANRYAHSPSFQGESPFANGGGCVPVISEGRLLSGDLEKADVWSLGVTLFAMVTGHTPWEEATPRHRIAEILRGSGSPKGPTDGDGDEHEHGVAGRFDLPPSLVDLLEGMLAFRPRERLSVSQVSHHPWVITHPPTSPSKSLSPPTSTSSSTSSLTSTSTSTSTHVSAAFAPVAASPPPSSN